MVQNKSVSKRQTAPLIYTGISRACQTGIRRTSVVVHIIEDDKIGSVHLRRVQCIQLNSQTPSPHHRCLSTTTSISSTSGPVHSAATEQLAEGASKFVVEDGVEYGVDAGI